MPFCDRHFASDRFRLTNGTKVLRQGSVPTIYYSRKGEKSILTFDRLTRQYVGTQADNLKADGKIAYSRDHLVAQRLDEVAKLKSLCRVCFTRSGGKCVSLGKLENFNLSLTKLQSQLDMDVEHQKVFSELICEGCFVKLVEFEKFRAKCVENRAKVEEKLNFLDEKIHECHEDCEDYFGDEEAINGAWYDMEVAENVNEAEEEKNFREISAKIEQSLKVLTDVRVKNEEIVRNGADVDCYVTMDVENPDDEIKDEVYENERVEGEKNLTIFLKKYV